MTDSANLRGDGRQPDQLRPIRFHNGFAPHAAGSTLIEWGETRVICAVTVEESVPKWMQYQKVGGGWITSEYSMLPYSTLDRKPRELGKGRPEGRTVEIQRLIGRSLRAVVDLQKLGQHTLWIDCDVLQADGGTRTASITGAYLAARLAVQKLVDAKRIPENPMSDSVAAISVGLVAGVAPDAIRSAVAGFTGIPHRLETVGIVDGVRLGEEAGYMIVNARTLFDNGAMVGYCTDTVYDAVAGLEHELKSFSIVFSMADLHRIMGPNSARYVGMESEIGTLEVGKRADIILQSGNPTENIYGLLSTKLTMKDGRIVIDKR